MGLLTLFALPVVRAIMVYLLPLFYALARKNFPMNSQELKICWYSGMIRGNFLSIIFRSNSLCFVSSNWNWTFKIHYNCCSGSSSRNNINWIKFHEKFCQENWNLVKRWKSWIRKRNRWVFFCIIQILKRKRCLNCYIKIASIIEKCLDRWNYKFKKS